MQKSRVNWIIHGDRNTKYYHMVTTRKRLKRRIPRILNNQGQWIENQDGIANIFPDHFKELFTEHDSHP